MPDPNNPLIHSEDGWTFLLADIVAFKADADNSVWLVSLSNAQMAKVKTDSDLIDRWRAARSALLAPAAQARRGFFGR